MSVADKRVRKSLAALGTAVNKQLVEIAGEPYGFALLVYPLGREVRDLRASTNTDPLQVAKLLRRYADTLEGRDVVDEHAVTGTRH